MEYKVYDTAAYGIYNGFSEWDKGFDALLREELSVVCEISIFDYRDLKKKAIRELQDDEDVRRAAMAYYRPYPVLSWWSGEYKESYLRAIAERRAPGVCDIPDELVPDLIRPVVSQLLANYKKDKICACEETVRRAERQKAIPTVEMAEHWQDIYNRIYNDGGEGYVPHVVTDVEYEQAKKALDILKGASSKREVSLAGQIEQATSLADRAGGVNRGNWECPVVSER